MTTNAAQLYFSNSNNLFVYTRPYEALFRDPWWIFTCFNLIWNIKRRYEFGYLELVRVAPRFGILIAAMFLSISFILIDILAVTRVISGPGVPDGINPFWKLAFVFKCLTDTIVLDDFKTALDRLKDYRLERMGSVLSDGIRADSVQVEQANRKKAERANKPQMQALPNTTSRDFSKADCQHVDLENMDFAQALRMDYWEQAESSRSRGG